MSSKLIKAKITTMYEDTKFLQYTRKNEILIRSTKKTNEEVFNPFVAFNNLSGFVPQPNLI